LCPFDCLYDVLVFEYIKSRGFKELIGNELMSEFEERRNNK